jgi:hypothetical protein
VFGLWLALIVLFPVAAVGGTDFAGAPELLVLTLLFVLAGALGTRWLLRPNR